ncbi:MAG: hypothetical protein ABSF48_20525 [Thermodesulfobacteriota bacterium]
MRKILLTVLVLIYVLVFSSMAGATMDVKLYGKVRETQEFKLYIKGVGFGLVVANTYMLIENKERLFCQPMNLVLETENFIRILDDEIARQELQDFKKTQETSIELLLVRGLIHTFPCK